MVGACWPVVALFRTNVFATAAYLPRVRVFQCVCAYAYARLCVPVRVVSLALAEFSSQWEWWLAAFRVRLGDDADRCPLHWEHRMHRERLAECVRMRERVPHVVALSDQQPRDRRMPVAQEGSSVTHT